MSDQQPPQLPPVPPPSGPPPAGEAGEPLGANYMMFEVIGRGAMGVVRRAVTTRGDSVTVAVKILRPELVEDQVIVGRFLQERAILTNVNHVNVVRVRDLVAEGQTLAIVMDLIVGPDLRTELKNRGTLPPAEAAAYVAGICRGLAAVHGVGVIHRDVKPENVLLERQGGSTVPKVNDFGVSKLVTGREGSRNTSVIGTPDYMAPELIDDHEPSVATDLYAVGIVLYELLCGITPFVGGSPLAVLRKHAELAPGRPPGMPDQLWVIISELLAKDPKQRPASAALVAAALESSLGALSSVPTLPRLTTPPLPDPDSQTYHETLVPTTVRTPAPVVAKSRRKAVIAVVAVVLVLAVAGTAVALSLGSGKKTPAAATKTGSATPTVAAPTTTSAAATTSVAPALTTSAVAPASAVAPSSAPSAPASTAPATTAPSVPTTPAPTTTTKAPPNPGAAMPDLHGKSLADAAAALDALGIQYTTKVVLSSKTVDNTVKAQTPAAGKPAGTHVVLTVSRVPAITYLADVGSLGQGPGTGSVNIGGTTYTHAVSTGSFYHNDCADSTTWNYDLSKSFRILGGTVGVTDDSDQASVFRVEIFTDTRRVYNKAVSLGHPVSVNVDVTDALRMTITITKLGCHSETLDSTVAFADPQLFGLPSKSVQPSSAS